MAFSYLAYEESRSAMAAMVDRAYLRRVNDPLDLNREEFVKLYRLTQDATESIIDQINAEIKGTRITALSVEKQVLAALRFYATGCYQRPVGEQWGVTMSQTSISRCIHKVTDAINKVMFRRYIRFPMSAIERHEAKAKWVNARYPFPGAIGAIDCTHVAIRGPREHEEAYVNHHGYHSINVQMICDPTMKILNVNARYPGARHDSYIWSASAARRVMSRAYERGERGVFLIGDSGYPLEPWLMTPLPHEQEGTARYRYNEALCKARNAVERLFGVLKSTWRCLLGERVLIYDPGFAGRIVNAGSVLHNIRIEEWDYQVVEDMPQTSSDQVNDSSEENLRPNAVAKRVQDRIIARY